MIVRSTLMAGRVKTQTFKPGGQQQQQHDITGGGGRGGWKSSSTQDKNELTFQRAFQQVIFAIILNLASSGINHFYYDHYYLLSVNLEKCRKNMCELGALSLFCKYLAIPPAMPIEISTLKQSIIINKMTKTHILQANLKAMFSLTTAGIHFLSFLFFF